MPSSSSFQMPPNDWKEVQALPGNSTCADCSNPHPEWASVAHGALICIDCSGPHRGLGTHICFVRSIKMDSWSDKQLQSMKLGGNQKLNDYLGNKNNNSAREKYDNDTAQLYKLQLKARVEGTTPIPTALPPPRKKQEYQSKYQGISGGSAPAAKKKKSMSGTIVKTIGVAAVVVVGAWLGSR